MEVIEREEDNMELVSKLKELIPWGRKSVEPHEVLTLRDDINRLFDRFFLAPFDQAWLTTRGWSSGLDIEETEDEVIVRADVPGIEPQDLNVMARDGMLEIRYERRDEQSNGGWTQRRYGAFSRTVALPGQLDTAAARATCRHGVLVVRIPRTEEGKHRVRRIPIQG
jgi:HSP20 family protein